MLSIEKWLKISDPPSPTNPYKCEQNTPWGVVPVRGEWGTFVGNCTSKSNRSCLLWL